VRGPANATGTSLRLSSPTHALQYRTEEGSIVAPATAESVLAVGASDYASGHRSRSARARPDCRRPPRRRRRRTGRVPRREPTGRVRRLLGRGAVRRGRGGARPRRELLLSTATRSNGSSKERHRRRRTGPRPGGGYGRGRRRRQSNGPERDRLKRDLSQAQRLVRRPSRNEQTLTRMSGLIDSIQDRTATSNEHARVLEMADADADEVLNALSSTPRGPRSGRCSTNRARLQKSRIRSIRRSRTSTTTSRTCRTPTSSNLSTLSTRRKATR